MYNYDVVFNLFIENGLCDVHDLPNNIHNTYTKMDTSVMDIIHNTPLNIMDTGYYRIIYIL